MMAGYTFEQVMERLTAMEFTEQFDMIVAIAQGGCIPAELLSRKLGLSVFKLHINLRDQNHTPRYDSPRLVCPIDFDFEGKRILLVEDRIKTGATVHFAVELLAKAKVVKTFAVNGNADYALYNEACFRFPWVLAAPAKRDIYSLDIQPNRP